MADERDALRIARIEQDGFTTCVIDQHGDSHCFRIAKELGAQLVAIAGRESVRAQEPRRNFDTLRCLVEDRSWPSCPSPEGFANLRSDIADLLTAYDAKQDVRAQTIEECARVSESDKYRRCSCAESIRAIAARSQQPPPQDSQT